MSQINKAFTLIETIIYITLFTLLMGTVFITAYEIISSSRALSTRTEIQNEGNFVIRKINWAMIGVETIITPAITNSKNLRIIKHDGTKIHICLDKDKIKIHDGNYGSCNDANYISLTTDNVSVSDLEFEFIPAVGSGPSGVKAKITITKNNQDYLFSITKHLRK